MSATKSIYKIVRNVLLAAVIVVIALFVSIYIALSVPAVQSRLKAEAETELSNLLKSKVIINELEIRPFNELRLHGVSILNPQGQRCISVGRIGAGIEFWPLLLHREINIAYAEIIGLNAKIEQSAPGGPLNIQFLFDALKPKEKKKKTKFNLALNNVVIRKSNIGFNRTYIPRSENPNILDFNHLEFYALNADVTLPKISDNNIEVDLRRLTFLERSGLNLRSISLKACIAEKLISWSDLRVKIGSSTIKVSDQKLNINGYSDILPALMRGKQSLRLKASPIYPADFSTLMPQLRAFDTPFYLDLDAEGSPDNFQISELKLYDRNGDVNVDATGEISGLTSAKSAKGSFENLTLNLSEEYINKTCTSFASLPESAMKIISALGDINLDAKAEFDLAEATAKAMASINSDAGQLSFSGDLNWANSRLQGSQLLLKTESFNVGKVLNNEQLGAVAIEADGEFSLQAKNADGRINAVIPFLELNGNNIADIHLEASKSGKHVEGKASVDNEFAQLVADIVCTLDNEDSEFDIKTDVGYIQPAAFGVNNFKPGDFVRADIVANISGNNVDNLTGALVIDDVEISTQKHLRINHISLTGSRDETRTNYALDSDHIKLTAGGDFKPTAMVGLVRNLIAENLYSLISPANNVDANGQYANVNLSIQPSEELFQFLKAPMRPGVPVEIGAEIDGSAQSMHLSADAPYLIQGKNKLIKSTRIGVSATYGSPMTVNVKTDYPLKNDRASVNLDLSLLNNHIDTGLGWIMVNNQDNRGNINVGVDLSKRSYDHKLAVTAIINDSKFKINNADWTISPAVVHFADKTLTASTIRIAHDLQFITIGGRASQNPLDMIEVRLAGIDLEYLFNILNINHVNFGGIATGTAHMSNIFNGTPIAQTDGLFVKNLAYNGSVLGDGQLESHWDNSQGLVAINADISGTENAAASVRGGVFVTRDSLSFDFDARKLNIEFLKPFVSGFTSDIRGKATGHVKLFGTFSDIDLTGRVLADTLTMRVDYTNVEYSTSDSVIFEPGLIRIPELRLYDKYGNSGLFAGEVTHKFLKDPQFKFRLKDARKLLAYDVPQRQGERWSGHIFVNGNASLNGLPGRILLDINASTAPGSQFTFVLDETQTASEYAFLSFSDRRKEELEREILKNETFEEKFARNNSKSEIDRRDIFTLNMGVDVTRDVNMVIVMDPTAGDKIKAVGSGALQMHYSTDSDEMTLYGKYTLDRGDYNFSLQDLILKNFKIEKGSGISFNGDPEAGILDIVAAYRVNTNLTDLDQSFKNDGDLNRTSVPVDALLKVTGDIQSPDINFDLRLPTINPEAERKVRSIISTEDMLNRQVIYLLALNRFYTPEYSGGDQGGELASVASSTLSSQIQNMMSSLTDKFSLSPTFKSERSDLSDMGFDVALSSSLFDNRLLINGNLGYRDKSTSQTTFIGDFDIEYLLTHDGKLRLKAYNHFNDASYYLKSSLTTQGIGVVYRKDFNDPFTFLKRKKRKKTAK